MLQLGKPAATHIPPGSGSPDRVWGRSRRECSGAGGNGEAPIPLLPTKQAARAGWESCAAFPSWSLCLCTRLTIQE